MTELVTSLLIMANYIGAAVNVYFWMKGAESAPFNAAVAVFAFGTAQFLTAQLGKY